MRLLDSFERKIVFPLMRLIALLAVIALLAAAVASVAGYFVWPAGAQEGGTPTTMRQVVVRPVEREPAETPEESRGIRDRVSEIVVDIRERAPDAKQVAIAAKGYAAGMLDELKDNFVFGALAHLGWIASVISIAAGVFLMGFFTLVLVFLAIERNTRKGEG